MIIRKEDLQTVCSRISNAIDNSELAPITKSLSLSTKDTYFIASVTNREYYAEARVDLKESTTFTATVDAELFTKLVSKITSDTVELTVNDNRELIINANGKYKVPLIYNNDTMLELPTIEIENVVNKFDIDASILNSILQYNSKELNKGVISRPVQKMYYVDDEGAITFTTGACVNNFKLSEKVKLLFNARLVKLFKMFNEGTVHFTCGVDKIVDGVNQTKVIFENDEFSVTAILSSDEALINSVPVSAIRGRANNNYANSVELNKDELVRCLDRLLIFYNFNTTKPYSTFDFDADAVTIHGTSNDIQETIYYNTSSTGISYKAMLNLEDLKVTLDSCTEKYITLNFGNSQAIVLEHGNIKNVIPEVKVS